jgi:hypothetical protein
MIINDIKKLLMIRKDHILTKHAKSRMKERNIIHTLADEEKLTL